jgi:uncharacterized delta-60 repeat protein
MAIVSSGSFAAASSKIAGNTLAFTSSQNILAGDLAVLFVAMDNPTTGTATNFVTSVRDNSINYNFAQGRGFNNTAYSIVSQSDGKLLVGGAFTSYNGQDAPYIARLNTDGTLDTTFNPNYREIDGIVYKLAIQPDVTGSYYSGSGGVWSDSNTLITARTNLGGAGTQNASLAFGGAIPATPVSTCTEEYDGTSWTAGGALITARVALGGAGTQNAGLAFGGAISPGATVSTGTEEYNGSVWATGTALITARYILAGAGTQNAGLAFGGLSAISTVSCTEEYDGTSWTAGGALITARYSLGGTGTQNTGLAFGGFEVSQCACTEEYNGTSWTAVNALTTARQYLAGAGTQNAGLAFGGFISPLSLSCTEEYDGTSWTAGGALITVRFSLAGTGTLNTGLAAGGSTPTSVSCTEEYNLTTTATCISDKIIAVGDLTNRAIRLNPDGSEDPSFNVGTGFNNTVCTVIVQDYSNCTYSCVITDAWSAKSALIIARSTLAGAGTQNAALAIGGDSGSISLCTEEYDGSAWTAGGNLTLALSSAAGVGTQNAALVAGGLFPGPTLNNSSQEYNGTSWSAGGVLATARYRLAGAGTQNEALAFGGLTPTLASCTEEYNGTTWTAGNVLITAREGLAGVGTQNEALAFGGVAPLAVACTEEYNGTSWSTGGALTIAATYLAGAGTQNAALAFGGSTGSITNYTQKYNGSTWVSSTPLITARWFLGGAGAQNTSLAFGGALAPGTTIASCTEEYTYEIVSGSGYIIGGIWSAGGALITARYYLGGVGTQNEGLAIGGTLGDQCTEEYNGSAWTNGGTLINGKSSGGSAGIQNEALSFDSVSTEEYNGISWSSATSLINGRLFLAGAGTQNAALAFGGSTPAITAGTEEYNGTSWTTGGALIAARGSLAGAGIQNAALAFGGATPADTSCTEEYNGTSWIAGGNLITARVNLAGTGTQNEALAFGGSFNNPAGGVFYDKCTEKYDGSIWSTTTSLTNGRSALAGAGTQNNGLAFGGFNGVSQVTCTEEYTFDLNTSYFNKLIFGGAFTSYNGSTYSGSVRINGGGTIDTSFNIGAGFASPVDVRCFQFIDLIGTWTAGGAMIIAKDDAAGAGTQNAGLSFGGLTGSLTLCTEEYDGTSWTTNVSIISARSSLKGAGTQNAGLAFGGNTPTSGKRNATEKYDGTSWTTVNSMIQSRASLGGAGTQNLALAFGGETPTFVACTEEYDGTTWTVGGVLIVARSSITGTGTQNAGLAFGGVLAAPTFAQQSSTEEYDGTSWTAGGALITARSSLGGAGTQNAGLAFGGNAPARSCCTEEYNGVSWSTVNRLITTRGALEGAGTQTAALAFGGIVPGPVTVACTEEYSTVTSLLTVGNFTSVSGSTRNRIALLNANDGTLVLTSSFNMGSAGFNSAANSIAVLSDNSIVAVGAFTAYSGSNINRIAKINTNGTLNTTFSASIGAGLNNTGSVVVNYPFNSSTWSTGNALITTRCGLAGAGTQNAGLAFGGGIEGSPFTVSCTEEYNGSTWTAGGALITTRESLAGAGTQNEALAFGGATLGPFLLYSCTEEYDGSAWAAGGALITARCNIGGTGTQNEGLAFGGSPIGGCTEEYNGTSWSSGGVLITGRPALAGAGTQNAGLAFGGAISPSSATCTEEYNGTSWSSGGALIIARDSLAGAGTQNAGLAAGGFPGSSNSCTEEYDGSVWIAGINLINGRARIAGTGIQNAALAFGGFISPALVGCTEEYYKSSNSLLVGGTFTSFAGNTRSGSIRILNVGVLDSSFNIGSGFGAAVDVDDFLINVDSSIIAVGGFTTYSGSFSPSPNRIVKINTNGSIDATSTGNTWSKVSERSSNDAAGAGATLALFYLTASFNIPAGTPITASLSASVTAKAATGWRFVTDTPAVVYTGSVTSSAAGGTSQPLRINLANLTSGSGNYLFIRGVAFENVNTTIFTPTANYTTMSAAGTTGGANITNQSVRGEFRVLTTASYFSNPTLGAASSQASIFWTFYESAAVAGGRTYFILLD